MNIYAEALPRLRAQETLNLAAAFSLGSGSMKELDQRTLRNELIQQAGVTRQRELVPAAVRDAAVAGMGIKVIHRGS